MSGLFSQGTIDAMRDAYAEVGTPVTVQSWNPWSRRLELEVMWLDGCALPGAGASLDWDEG